MELLVALRKHTPVQAPVPPISRVTALGPLVAPLAWSNQSRVDSHNTLAAISIYFNDWGSFLANNLLLSHYTELWIGYGFKLSTLHLWQIDCGPYQRSVLTSINQATTSVIIINYVHPQSA